MKRKFTDRFVKTVKAAPPGKRVEYYDTMVPCFGLRVTDRAHRTYVLYRKFPGAKCATRREIGNAALMKLVSARKVAEDWNDLVSLGVDPGEKARAAEAEAQLKKLTTFASVAEAWFRRGR